MFKHIFETVGKEISGENAKNLATEVTRFHRIQVSPHFREAAEWCQNQLTKYGLHCAVHQFKADGKTTYWTSLLPQEWRIESATLEIDGTIWADFRDKKVSLIQRSHPIAVEAELVHVETDDEEAFRAVKGKIVHSPLPLESIKDFALHYGALGIITSGIREITMRTRIDVPDAVHYFSFWGEKGSGFVLSPRQGEKLKNLIKEKGKKEEPVTAKMVIKSELYPGFMEVVDAFIPGKTDEEVLIVAHLCHPQPSANDNASGDGALMEVARTLQKLINDGKLEEPKRGIRFLLVPEMHGTIAYLASNEEKIPSIVAGMNLDMVGENQDLCKSPLLLERTPDAMPSFINDLAEVIFEELTYEIGNLSGTSRYASFKHAVTPFSGGSDHYILSDPSVDIPCPMIIHWPDLFYHSSLDTPEKLDPVELERVGKLTSTYAYFIANAGEKEAEWLAVMICEKSKERISKKVREILTNMSEKREEKEAGEEKIDYHGFLDYLLERMILTLQSVKKLADISIESLEKELRQFVSVEKEKISYSKPEEKEACSWIPVRKYRGPISVRKTLLELPFEERRTYEEKQKECEDSRLLGTLAVYWSDGKRTLSEIDRLITYEIGRSSLDYLKWYFEFLETHNLITLQR
jgi:aminopeptidase YwaD